MFCFGYSYASSCLILYILCYRRYPLDGYYNFNSQCLLNVHYLPGTVLTVFAGTPHLTEVAGRALSYFYLTETEAQGDLMVSSL